MPRYRVPIEERCQGLWKTNHICRGLLGKVLHRSEYATHDPERAWLYRQLLNSSLACWFALLSFTGRQKWTVSVSS